MAAQDDEKGEVLADEPVYVISVAAKLAGLPSWTLRLYDKEGIVCPQRTSKDRRLYSDRDIARLARVRYLTEERGVNMNGVRLILEMEGSSLDAERERAQSSRFGAEQLDAADERRSHAQSDPHSHSSESEDQGD